MPVNELKQQAEALGIVMSFDQNFWNMGPCVIATFSTRNGTGCDYALGWIKDFGNQDNAETYVLKVAIRNASPSDSNEEAQHG